MDTKAYNSVRQSKDAFALPFLLLEVGLLRPRSAEFSI